MSAVGSGSGGMFRAFGTAIQTQTGLGAGAISKVGASVSSVTNKVTQAHIITTTQYSRGFFNKNCYSMTSINLQQSHLSAQLPGQAARVHSLSSDVLHSEQVAHMQGSHGTAASAAADQAEKQKVGQLASQLPIVKKIRSVLQQNKAVVLTGPVGSCKTAQVSLAGGTCKEFSLKKEFLTSYYKDQKIVDQATQDTIWDTMYYDIKPSEAAWLEDKFEEIKNDLLESEEEVIVFSKFDLDSSDQLRSEGFKSAGLILDLAKQLVDGGKKVVFVMNPTGLNTSQLVDKLESNHFLTFDSDVEKTSFLPKQNQLDILFKMGIAKKPEEAERIAEYTMGVPAAYGPFIEYAVEVEQLGPPACGYKPSDEQFLLEAGKKVKQTIAVLQQIKPKIIKYLLDCISNDKLMHKPVFFNISEELEQDLLESGLVCKGPGSEMEGMVTLVIPGIVRDILGDLLNEEDLKKMGKMPSAVMTPLSSLSDIRFLQDRALAPALLKAAAYAVQTGGARYFHIVNKGLDMDVVAPITSSHPRNITIAAKKAKIAKNIDMQAHPEETTTVEHQMWLNSATTVADLYQDGKTTAPVFLEIMHDLAKKTGTVCYCGDDNEFLLKSQQSMQRKVNTNATRGRSEASAVSKLNDTLRTTFITQEPKHLKACIDAFVAQAKEKGIEIVFSDKFKEDYHTGYVAVHATTYMQVPGTERKIQGEVQFHLKHIHDGTSNSVKELSHKIFEVTRLGNESEKEDDIEARQKQAFKRIALNSQRNLFNSGVEAIKNLQ